ncbi:progestin and adipoQ receptor family member 4-like protein [Leptotrombidium deliense]|uniref:Progestin and adipoQ receptor family member 4-like protein n=1 Tax=Leptotrombidium deliense TaxID=299467 RepID=A0A443SVB5_9ACAR|nr:progestin and adipoQ receptor family member 4-like protein [Leptotrombidium deliense]
MNTHDFCLNGNVTNVAKAVNVILSCPSNTCYSKENKENIEEQEDLKINYNSRRDCSDTQQKSVFKTNGALDSLNGASPLQQKHNLAEKSKDRLPKLQKITDVPNYLQFNPYVLTGYRPPGLTYWQCIHSLSYIHNETVNILTHGIPFICFLLLTPANIPWNQINHPILACFHIMGSVAPWLGSTIYHLFMNHEKGEKFYRELLKWDVIGIWITQSFGASTTVYTSVALYPDYFRYTFVSLYIILSIRALKDSAMTDCVWRRRLGFTFLVLMRFIAFFCRLSTFADGEGSVISIENRTEVTVLSIGRTSVRRRSMLEMRLHSFQRIMKYFHLAMQEVLPIVGAFISASRIPERWFPGNFDFILNSHNIMHVFVVLGGIHMHMATCTDLIWLANKDRNNVPEVLLPIT